MYEIIKNVIESGRYELSAMCRKIDTMWGKSLITEAQWTELLTLAREKADPQMSVDLYTKVMELESRVDDLENGKAPDKPLDDFPEFVVGKTYRNGNGVTFQGTRYRCIAPEGAVCVWSPKDYPAYWEAA